MRITVQAYATLGDILGSRNVEVSTTAKTVGELIDFIAERFGESFKERLIDSQTNELKRLYRIIVNGRNVESLNKLKTGINEGDRVLFFPPVGGG